MAKSKRGPGQGSRPQAGPGLSLQSVQVLTSLVRGVAFEGLSKKAAVHELITPGALGPHEEALTKVLKRPLITVEGKAARLGPGWGEADARKFVAAGQSILAAYDEIASGKFMESESAAWALYPSTASTLAPAVLALVARRLRSGPAEELARIAPPLGLSTVVIDVLGPGDKGRVDKVRSGACDFATVHLEPLPREAKRLDYCPGGLSAAEAAPRPWPAWELGGMTAIALPVCAHLPRLQLACAARAILESELKGARGLDGLGRALIRNGAVVPSSDQPPDRAVRYLFGRALEAARRGGATGGLILRAPTNRHVRRWVADGLGIGVAAPPADPPVGPPAPELFYRPLDDFDCGGYPDWSRALSPLRYALYLPTRHLEPPSTPRAHGRGGWVLKPGSMAPLAELTLRALEEVCVHAAGGDSGSVVVRWPAQLAEEEGEGAALREALRLLRVAELPDDALFPGEGPMRALVIDLYL